MPPPGPSPHPTGIVGRLRSAAPGVALCAAVALAAFGLQWAEEALFGRPYLDTLVLAILLGMAVRTAWRPPARFAPGLTLAAKTLLEVAVALLGASLSLQLVLSVGAGLVGVVAAVVAVALVASYAIGRLLGLPWRMAVLIAAGNSICGNSAIAAVAPVIGASSQDIASSVTFTAVLGVVVVLALPLTVPLAGLSETQYGVVAGLTVYAVPQVLAAAAPVGPLSLQIGTFVKLVRVLMLGPIVVALTLFGHRLDRERRGAAAAPARLSRLVPWFIVGFLGLMAARTVGLIPPALVDEATLAAKVLTMLAMAALGLGVDVAAVAEAGPRATGAVVLSIAVLALLSVGVVQSGLVR